MTDGCFDAPDDARANAAFIKRYPELQDPARAPAVWGGAVQVRTVSAAGFGEDLWVPEDLPPEWRVAERRDTPVRICSGENDLTAADLMEVIVYRREAWVDGMGRRLVVYRRGSG